MQKSINGAMLRKMILNGAKLLDINKEHVDSLNVFPVPDGHRHEYVAYDVLGGERSFCLPQ